MRSDKRRRLLRRAATSQATSSRLEHTASPWADLLKKVFALDVVAFPAFSGRLKLIAFIASEAVARRILDQVDTTNGMNVRLDPREWAFPNVDLSVHLYRAPQGGPGRWIGFDTLVTVGAGGIGLTSTTLHDESGPVGRVEQILTVRPMAGWA